MKQFVRLVTMTVYKLSHIDPNGNMKQKQVATMASYLHRLNLKYKRPKINKSIA